jgi:transportin-3
MIGRYSECLSLHAGPQFPTLLQFLADSLTIKECASAAAIAIRELCEYANPERFAIAAYVLMLYEDLSTRGKQLEASTGEELISLKAELALLEGVGKSVSRHILETRLSDEGVGFLTRLAQPLGNHLALLVGDSSITSPRKIIADIERLIVVVQYLKLPSPGSFGGPNSAGTHPMIELVRSLWPILDAATTRFPSVFDLAEKVCRLHKHTLRVLGRDVYAPLLPGLLEQLVRSYEQSHQSPYLYAASIAVTEYGRLGDRYAQPLYMTVAAMATTTFSFLRSMEDFTKHPDVVEEFFYLIGRMMNHCPTPLVMSALLPSIFQCAAVAMQLSHHGASEGTLQFIDSTVGYGLGLQHGANKNCEGALEQVFATEGQAIVNNLTRAMTGTLPVSQKAFNRVGDVFWKLHKLYPGLSLQFLSAALDATAPYVPQRTKDELLGAMDEGLAIDEFSLAVGAFQSACDRERRFHESMPQRAGIPSH